jgi:DNA-binding HxlR family transcriptional regulator
MRPKLPPECPRFKAAMAVLGRPWTGLILNALSERPLRYCELSERLSMLGDKTLSARLKELEAKGLVHRTVHTQAPIRVEYALTRKGLGFREVAHAIEKWGGVLLEEETPAASPAARRARKAG